MLLTSLKFRRNPLVLAWARIEVIVICTAVGLLLCIGALWVYESRATARAICCNCNLKQIGLAFLIWSDDRHGVYPMGISVTNGGAREFVATGDVASVFQVMSNELCTPVVLVCPADAARTPSKSFTTNFSNRNVSYFVGLDASESMPEMLLSGDRNITNASPIRRGILELPTNQRAGWTADLHNGRGNIALADGSVLQVNNSQLNQALQNSGVATNRIAIP